MKSTDLCSKLLVFALAMNNFYPPEADASVLHINPNKLQFFEYDTIQLSCSAGTDEWKVMQASTSTAARWEKSLRSLKIYPASVRDSGAYWCEDKEGKKSNKLNIVVTAGDVILESPALPVVEGQTVTLSCEKRQSTLNSAADFFKDGLLKETEYKGKMTLYNVSWSSEGVYKCMISGAGESPESRLSVRASNKDDLLGTTSSSRVEETAEPSRPPALHSVESTQLTTLLSVFFSVLFVAFLLLLTGFLHHRKHKAKRVNSGTSSRESDPVYENATTIAPDMSLYASVSRKKIKRARRGSSETSTLELNPVYVNSDETDPNMTVYASVSKHRR